MDKQVSGNTSVSIIIPTYNESKNILGLLTSINRIIPRNLIAQTIIVDDNSPDGTGNLVDHYVNNLKKFTNNTIEVIHRKTKSGLGSAILNGIQHAMGDTIIIMDSDFSHPPTIIPKLIDTIKKYQYDIVIASRYVKGGNIVGWPLRRRLLSKFATVIAKRGLGVETDDPISGYFAFKKNLLKGLQLDALGYKLLLEILVKAKNASVKEIPYTFYERQRGKSKLDLKTVLDYCHSVWKLYRYGKRASTNERRPSVRFLSKAARFFTVGASGFGINYLTSLVLTSGIFSMWYLHANMVGIIASMTSNFLFNKTWTFEDKDFALRRTLSQYIKFVGISSGGALAQIGMVYYLMEEHSLVYPVSLLVAVSIAAFGNFVLNKRLTFREKIWS